MKKVSKIIKKVIFSQENNDFFGNIITLEVFVVHESLSMFWNREKITFIWYYDAYHVVPSDKEL